MDSVPNELELIIAEYLRARESGETVDVEAWIKKHPGFASDLRSFIETHSQLNQHLEPLRQSIIAPTLANPLDAKQQDHPNLGRSSFLRYFGDYELLDEIARGGMGVVFRAKQITLDRIVAVKMISAGLLASPESETRFRLEAQAAASLDHPNIVPIYEVGETDGHRYYSMKFIEGSSLATICKNKTEKPQTAEWAVRLMASVAHAVHHAHQRGILHRDIKPGNILIDPTGEPHVTDFGLAKRFDSEADLTHSNALVGTPSYMAPEQARGEKNLTTSVDVFSIGAVLFELIFDAPPHAGSTPAATIAQILSSDSVKFPKRSPPLDSDLETILRKSLQYQPEHRYVSATALADDLECWLEGKPISARRSSVGEQVLKWARRKPAIAALSLALAITMLLSVVTILREWQIAVAARKDADEVAERAIVAESKEHQLRLRSENLRLDLLKERDLLDRTRYLAQMQLAGHEWRAGARSNLKELLDDQVARPSNSDQRSWEWYFLRGQLRGSVTATGFKMPVSKLAWEPNGRRIAASGYHSNQSSGMLYMIDSSTGEMDPRFGEELPYRLNEVAWSPDGQWFAIGGGNLSGFDNRLPGALTIWAAEGDWSLPLVGHMGPIQSISWSPDSTQIVVASGSFGPPGEIKIWDPNTGQMTKELLGIKNQAVAVDWSPNKKWIAGSSSQGDVLIWDADSGELLRQWKGDRQSIRTLSWSPDSALIVTDNPSHGIKIWDQEKGELVREIKFAKDIPTNLDWIADRILEVIYNDGHCVTIDVDSEARIERKAKGQHLGGNAASSPNRDRIAFLQSNGVLSIEPFEPAPTLETIENADARTGAVRWSPDGSTIATSGSNVSLWNASTQKKEAVYPWPDRWQVVAAEFSPDGKWMATSSLQRFSGTIHVLDLVNQKNVSEWNGHLGMVTSIAWSIDNERFVTLGSDNTIRVWDASTTDKMIGEWATQGVSLATMARHPTLDILAVGCGNGEVALIEFPADANLQLSPKATQRMHESEIRAICWNHDGTMLATCGSDGLKLWSGDKMELVQTIPNSLPYITSLAFRPLYKNEPARLTALVSGTIKMWDVDTGREAITLLALEAVSFSWSPDGDRIVIAKRNGKCTIWNSGIGRSVHHE